MEVLYQALEWIMNGCYAICHNYGIAIILFTLISKIILLPVSIWVQKNSIKMVKMQPEINFLMAKHFGDKDTIAEEQAKIYKREKYHPMASMIPLVIQLLLLMGVIEVIKRGMTTDGVSMMFLGIDLSLVPSQDGISLIWSPIIAGLSAWIMCVAQNASNVLQSEQSKLNKYGMMAFSVGLSLYLGWFVSIGVALYWVASNLFAVVQLYLLNWAINPKNYVDYEALEKSKKELEKLGQIGTKKRKFNDPESKRERQDYKKFFSVVNKHLVFYSEGSGFYKYYQGMIEYLLEKTNLTIHYITSDPDDQVFEIAKTNDKLRPYYIGEKRLITLMMKLEADVVVMTMPDLENFHIKRSYLRKDIEYIYVPHGMDSLNLTMRTGSMDHYDTVFCVGKHQREEIEKTEAAYGLPKKKLINWGYSLLDSMRADYQNLAKTESTDRKKILIAPSWQEGNIVDSCLEQILDELKGQGYMITVRPHPQHVRHRAEFMEQLKTKYAQNPDIEIQTDFSSNSTVFEADLMITDWSGIAYEYAYTTQKPVLFINTPMKVMNPEYQKIDTVPLNILLREEIGCSVNLEDLSTLKEKVQDLLSQKEQYYDKIGNFVQEYVYNLGTSAEVGANYMISAIQKKIDEKKNK